MRLFVAFTVAVVVGLAPLPGYAHGTFIDARPLPGVTVGGTVDQVAFLFPEPVHVESAAITVTAPDGATVSPVGDVEHPAAAVIRVAIEALTVAGDYRVSHRVTATDGFVFEGEFGFRYDPDAPALAPLPYGREGWTWETWVVVGTLLVTAVVMVRRKVVSPPGGGASVG